MLFCIEILTATAMGHFESKVEKPAVLAVLVLLVVFSAANSG